MKKFLSDRKITYNMLPRKAINLSPILFSLALYIFGIRFALLPCLVGYIAYYLPLPSIFQSVFSRLIVAALFVSCLVPILGTVQHILLKQTHFLVLSLILTLAVLWLVWASPKRARQSEVLFFGKTDLFGLCIGTLFAVPFLGSLIGRDGLASILQIAGSQVVDAGNHFSAITYFQYDQIMPLGGYPSGFEYAASYWQNLFFRNSLSIGWRANDLLYIIQYIIVAAALGYVAYYFCYSCLVRLMSRNVTGLKQLAAAAILAPTMIIVYLYPFMAEGFLNYFFVCTVLLLGLIMLFGVSGEGLGLGNRWKIFMFLIFSFGATSSWTLLVPLVLVIAFLYILPASITRAWVGEQLTWRSAPLVVVMLLHIALIYFQLKTLNIGGNAGINAVGNLHTLHYLVLLAGLGLVVWVISRPATNNDLKRLLVNAMTPSYLFVCCLTLAQYFMVGEVRYYAIKTALFVEIMTLSFATAILVWRLTEFTKINWKLWFMSPVMLLSVVVLLLSATASPLSDMREIFKPSSGIPKPTFYQEDANMFVKLGSEGLLKQSNSISLHYNSGVHKFDGYAEMSFVANLLQKDDSSQDNLAMSCNDKIYGRLEYGTGSSDDANTIVSQIPLCAHLAEKQGIKYYIVTDKTSAPYLEDKFGSVANIVY